MRQAKSIPVFDKNGRVVDPERPPGRDEVEEDGSDDGGGAEEVRRAFIPDVEYDGELGYSLIRTMRGRTTGRRLKRDLFKQGLSQFFVSVGMIIMTDQAARNYTVTNFFATSIFGKSLLSLWWLVCIIGFMLSFLTMFIVWGWPSLMTNRVLTSTVLKMYMIIQLVNWIFTLATLVTTFRTFGERKRYVPAGPLETTLFPYYLVSVFFLLPYMFCICANTMNLSYLNDEVEFGGTLLEPDVDPEELWDLSGMSLEQLALALIAYPIALVYQTLELIVAIYNLLLRIYRRLRLYIEDRWLQYQQEQAKAAKETKKRRGLIARIAKTLTRCFAQCLASCNREAILRAARQGQEERRKARQKEKEKKYETEQDLKNTAGLAKEEQERLERERAELEAERQYLRDKDERLRREAEQKAAKEEQERRQKEEEEKAQREREAAAAAAVSPILSVADFKTLWAALAVSSQFQCKLRDNPALMAFTEHLRKQGFHIVFGSTPSPEDVEVGVCNIRSAPSDPQFMARFLSSQRSFSAVMKCDNVDAVPAFVKKFALAKILSIDTTKK